MGLPMDVTPGSGLESSTGPGVEGSARVLPRPPMSCGCRQPQHFRGPLLAARDSIGSDPQISRCLDATARGSSGGAGVQVGFPIPPLCWPPAQGHLPLVWTLWGRGGGQGPRALKGPFPRIESRRGCPLPAFWGSSPLVESPRGAHLPPGRLPAPSCSWSSQPWCLSTISGHSPLLSSFLLPLLLPLCPGTP